MNSSAMPMSFKDLYKREVHVAIHGQSWKFRVKKYIVLLLISGAIYAWKGWETLGRVLLIMAVFAIAMHFFFRWKTNGWEKSWGLYKKIPL
jgi:hypothetical protein